MGVRVTLDPELCIGSGDCSRIVPTAFRLDEGQGVSVVLDGADEADAELLVRAAVNCPTQAIRVVAADGTVLHDGN